MCWVNGLGEAPCIYVDFLTVRTWIDKSSPLQPFVHCRLYPDSMYIQSEPRLSCTGLAHAKKPWSNTHTAHFPLTQTLSRANMNTHSHSRGRLSGMWDRAELALKEVWLSCLSQPSLSPAFTATSVCMVVCAHECTLPDLRLGNKPHSHACSCLCVLMHICTLLLTVWVCASGQAYVNPVIPSNKPTNHSRFKNGPLGIISPTCFGTMTLL